MASFDGDEDSFLLLPPSSSPPKRSLKRLKKKTSAGLASDIESSQLLSAPPPSSPLPFGGLGFGFGFASEDSNDSFASRALFSTVGGVESPSLQQDVFSDLNSESEDSDPDDRNDSSDGEDSDESDEHVDEDDELAVLNFLEKGRKSESNDLDCATEESLPTETSDHDAEKVRKKKCKASEMDEIHAASQRLLRETTNASFKPQIPCAKPISSVLEKIRLRKLQLSQGFESRMTSSIEVNHITTTTTTTRMSNSIQVNQITTAALEVEIVSEDSISLHDTVPCTDASIEQEISCANQEGTSLPHQAYNEKVGVPNRSDAQPDDSSSAAVEGSRNPFHKSVRDSQEEVDEGRSHNAQDVAQNDSLNMLLDTEAPEDCGNWDDEESDKENVAPACVPASIRRGGPVRALIDDEAEDEDEDVLALDDDEEADDEEALGDMIVEEVVDEGNVDVHKRAELHRKWLEQQDAANTDDILLRLKTGWKPRKNRKRGLEFLDGDLEEHDLPLKQPKNIKNMSEEMENDQAEEEMLDENSQSSAASKDEDCPAAVDVKLFESFGDVDDAHESSDEEEREERIMRQRFLQDSEDQGEFLLPADDETSREVFELINRANSATKNKKLKAGAVDLKLIGGGTTCSNSSFNSKASFLRKKATSASSSAQKQGISSTGSRSFIFGRDDSNSSHGFTDQKQRETMGNNKENLEPGILSSSSSSASSASSSSSGQMKMEAKQTTSRLGGPSLFEILRGQNKISDTHSPMHHKASPITPMFSAFKLIKANGKQVIPHTF